MPELNADAISKIEREHRLQWQSTALLTIIVAWSSASLLAMIWRSRTLATIEGLAICAVLGLIVWKLQAATPFAAVAGFLLTGTMYLATVSQPHGGWFHTALPPGLMLLILAFASTRFRRSLKEQTGLAESRKGRRAAQVAANMGAAAVAASLPIVFSFGYIRAWMPVALVAALAEAAADTVSSEIGQAVGGKPVLLTTLKRTPPGTDGAVSLVGTVTGCLAGTIVVATGIAAMQLDARQATIAWIGAIGGFVGDSVLGATLERGGWLNNDLVNFVSTVAAACIAMVCCNTLRH